MNLFLNSINSFWFFKSPKDESYTTLIFFNALCIPRLVNNTLSILFTVFNTDSQMPVYLHGITPPLLIPHSTHVACNHAINDYTPIYLLTSLE